ncbi:MAG TPA: hypothetical protein VF729_08130 [Solirubrobacterales bacterium]
MSASLSAIAISVVRHRCRLHRPFASGTAEKSCERPRKFAPVLDAAGGEDSHKTHSQAIHQAKINQPARTTSKGKSQQQEGRHSRQLSSHEKPTQARPQQPTATTLTPYHFVKRSMH